MQPWQTYNYPILVVWVQFKSLTARAGSLFASAAQLINRMFERRCGTRIICLWCPVMGSMHGPRIWIEMVLFRLWIDGKISSGTVHAWLVIYLVSVLKGLMQLKFVLFHREPEDFELGSLTTPPPNLLQPGINQVNSYAICPDDCCVDWSQSLWCATDHDNCVEQQFGHHCVILDCRVQMKILAPFSLPRPLNAR